MCWPWQWHLFNSSSWNGCKVRSLGTLIGFRPKIIILQTTAVWHQLWGRSFNRPIPNQNLTINSHYRLHSFALAKQGPIEGFKFFTQKKCINYWLSPIQFGKTIDYYSARWLSLIEFCPVCLVLHKYDSLFTVGVFLITTSSQAFAFSPFDLPQVQKC